MKKYKIGYTTEVYDMFHIGHLNIIKRAKEQCEYLIVGVSTDELVKSYKHKIPVIPFTERCAIVDAIKYVDKFAAWDELHFDDVMFHGDEWRGTELYNRYEKEFSKVGVEIAYIPHTEGVSSLMSHEKIEK